MLRFLAAIPAQDPIDPATLRPSPLSSVVFVFLLVATVLLLLSMRRHLGRARANLGSARVAPPGAPGRPGPGSGAAGDGAVRDVDAEDGSR